jgi:hypothetical protein
MWASLQPVLQLLQKNDHDPPVWHAHEKPYTTTDAHRMQRVLREYLEHEESLGYSGPAHGSSVLSHLRKERAVGANPDIYDARTRQVRPSHAG